jgi:endo-1,4-beta-mannosidase
MTTFANKFLLGVNYWSRAGGPRMWERFDAAVVRRELEQMRAIGLDCCRMFAFVPTFVKRPPEVETTPLQHLRSFAGWAAEAGLGLFPTALVGHMSGENYDFPGRNGRSLFGDAEMRAWQRALCVAMVQAIAGAPSVLGWVLSNEMPLWETGAPEPILAWCEELTRAIRAADPAARPIGTGDGVMPAFPTRALAPLVDWLGPHIYYSDSDPLRQAWQIDLAIRALQPLGKPVVLEEFGCSSAQAGEREQAAYFREAVLAAFGTGAQGAIGWCYSDFDPETLGRETPYSHHAFELGFGLTRADGSEKPVCEELRAIRHLIDGLDLPALERERPRAAIVRPRYLDEDFPFSWQDRESWKRTLLQAFVLASQAGLDPAVVGEDDDFTGYALLLCPSTQKLTTPTWLKLRDAANAGATVYWSYLYGDYNFHQGAWCPIFEQLTGLRHRLRYGCFDLPPDRVSLKGPFTLSVPTGVAHAAAPWPLSRLPIELRDGAPVRALAVDGEGRPALTTHALGRGSVIFLAYPFERYLALLPDGSQRDAHRLYRLLADEAGLEERYPTHHPDVQSRVLRHGADDLVLVQHRGWGESVDDAVEVPRDAEIVFDRAGRTDGRLGPKGARIYRVRGVR